MIDFTPVHFYRVQTLTKGISYIDSTRLVRGLTAGIQRLFQRREYIDRINVFPVPDGDTGTNMAFSFKVIHEAVRNAQGLPLKQTMARLASKNVNTNAMLLL